MSAWPEGGGVGVDHEFEGAALPVLYSAHYCALKRTGTVGSHPRGGRNPNPEAARVRRPPEDSLGTRCLEFGAEVTHVDTHRG